MTVVLKVVFAKRWEKFPANYRPTLQFQGCPSFVAWKFITSDLPSFTSLFEKLLQMDRVQNERRLSVFPNRPWMMSLGAAAAGGEGNKGLKGIVAGNV